MKSVSEVAVVGEVEDEVEGEMAKLMVYYSDGCGAKDMRTFSLCAFTWRTLSKDTITKIFYLKSKFVSRKASQVGTRTWNKMNYNNSNSDEDHHKTIMEQSTATLYTLSSHSGPNIYDGLSCQQYSQLWWTIAGMCESGSECDADPQRSEG